MQTNIEKNVMRRVHTIHVFRPIVSMGVLSVVVLALALWGIGREVWVAKVFTNGPQDMLGHAFYLTYAFEHTRFVVQALALLTGMCVVYLTRAIAHPSTIFSLNRFASS